ncbi:hypothetical protein Z947_4026 [Sulfitobacter geojensis]|nr:hypothetical protein Z947_4026 [Sulfitobacter geojensis]
MGKMKTQGALHLAVKPISNRTAHKTAAFRPNLKRGSSPICPR